jgi:enoyl ACP reductase
VAAKSIPAFATFEDVWDDRAPLGWSVHDPVPVARAMARPVTGWR